MTERRFYTTKGDSGRTSLYFGGRVSKNDAAPEAYGAVDEAQAFIGLARAKGRLLAELDDLLLAVERDLYVLMGELATPPQHRDKLGGQLVTTEMVERLGTITDDLSSRFEIPDGDFALPGETELSALLDVARTVVRRAERRSIGVAADGSHVVPYLNRLSSLLWAMARWQEGGAVPAKES